MIANVEGSVEGTALMQNTLQVLEDQEIDKSCYLGLLAKAYLSAGQLAQAEKTVLQGLNQSKKIGE